jgi:hypothetical protein
MIFALNDRLDMEHKKYLTGIIGVAALIHLFTKEMRENDILKLAILELDMQGKLWWIAYKRTGFAQQDIFGIFDIIYLQHDANKTGPSFGTSVGFIQCTTKHHLSDRRKKIRNFFMEKNIPIPPRCFVWAYDSDRASFIKENIS